MSENTGILNNENNFEEESSHKKDDISDKSTPSVGPVPSRQDISSKNAVHFEDGSDSKQKNNSENEGPINERENFQEEADNKGNISSSDQFLSKDAAISEEADSFGDEDISDQKNNSDDGVLSDKAVDSDNGNNVKNDDTPEEKNNPENETDSKKDCNSGKGNNSKKDNNSKNGGQCQEEVDRKGNLAITSSYDPKDFASLSGEEAFNKVHRDYIEHRYHDKIVSQALKFANGGKRPKKGQSAKIKQTDAYKQAYERFFAQLCEQDLPNVQNTKPVFLREYKKGNILTIKRAKKFYNKECLEKANQRCLDFLHTDDPEAMTMKYIDDHYDEIFQIAKDKVVETFADIDPDTVTDFCDDADYDWNYGRYDAAERYDDEEDDESLEEKVERYIAGFDWYEDCVCENQADTIADYVLANYKLIQDGIKAGLRYNNTKLKALIREWAQKHPLDHDIFEWYIEYYGDEDQRVEAVMHNKHFGLLDQEKERRRQQLISKIPERIPDLYPETRKMHRHFVLHIGPTNSGKTYVAMQDLKKAKTGVYLAPLRLLAFEQYDQMNRDGILCSLLTGEEAQIVPDASICASTIEMADLDMVYDAAVIDEAQMISDRDRGGAWTAAILGLQAEHIDICASEDAEKLLISLIEECGDDYEVVHHERKTPLVVEKTPFEFPQDVKKGDALIVFSRRDVHAVAAELRRKNISCSIIYGALPYDVRHRQAELFSSGKTDVVVSTDAIGMGMNLPIRRVVFLATQKFDGKEKRFLNASEVKQIAGRAGRYGQYETGYATSYGQRKLIRQLIGEPLAPLHHAMVSFQSSLLGIDGLLSDTINQWAQLPDSGVYKKEDTTKMIFFARELEKIDSAHKELEYQFLRIPFDDKDETLIAIWKRMFRSELNGEPYPVEKDIPSDPSGELQSAERQYRLCDLLFAYCQRFSHMGYTEEIMNAKKKISDRIFDLLKESKLEFRTCKYCGRKLPWNWPYGMCEKCHEERYSYRQYNEWNWNDDWY